VLSLPDRPADRLRVAAILVGIIAAIFPARRASRLNVLQALQYE
jgi:ABC-type lipoprotein release transport system permease subunit